MKIVLIRHTQLLIEPGICYGRLDVAPDPRAELNDTIAADPTLLGATHVWSSPASRCRGLAETIALALTVELTIDRRLQELDFGEWEGRSWDTVPRDELDRWAASPLTFAPPHGESGAELVARIRGFCAELRRDRRDCVIVSHGGPLKVLAALLERQPVDLLAPAMATGSIQVVTLGLG